MTDPAVSARSLAVLLGDWRDPDRPAVRALAARVRLLAVDGRLVDGTRLPAERELAAGLGVSRTTVSAAYAALREAGYLASRRGSGSVVVLPAPDVQRQVMSTAGYLDLTRAALPAHPLVLEEAQVATRALADVIDHVGYDLVGLPRLRGAVAARYAARGLPTTAEEVLATLGAQHGIALVARTLLSPGDVVLVESPTYPHAVEALRAAGGRPVAVPVTSEGGWDHDALEQLVTRRRPRLAYLMPDFQNPTGATMPGPQRESLLRLARRHRMTIVVDETTAELGIDRGGDRPFAAWATPAQADGVLTIGSVGKTLWGGLRIGWVRGSSATIRRLVMARAPHDLGTPLWEQLVVAGLLERWDDVLALRRAQLRVSRDALRAAVTSRLPAWHVPDVPGGVAAWINLGAPLSTRLVDAAQDAGLLLTAGPRFGLGGTFERFLRIPITASPHELEDAAQILAVEWDGLVAAGAVPVTDRGARPARGPDPDLLRASLV